MSVGRLASAIVVGMMAGGLTAMSGIGRHDMAAGMVDAPVAGAAVAVEQAVAGGRARPVLTPVDPR